MRIGAHGIDDEVGSMAPVQGELRIRAVVFLIIGLPGGGFGMTEGADPGVRPSAEKLAVVIPFAAGRGLVPMTTVSFSGRSRYSLSSIRLL